VKKYTVRFYWEIETDSPDAATAEITAADELRAMLDGGLVVEPADMHVTVSGTTSADAA
jgi:hypothetical protein